MPQAEEPAIVVTAVGRATATPDAVVVGLGVEVSAPTPGEALRRAGEQATALVGLLGREGVAEADRRTTGLSVHPAYDHRTGQPSGEHRAAYGRQATVADLDAAGRLVQAAAEAVGDALRVHHFGLSVRDPTPILAEARQAAVRAARSQAEQLAVAAGVGLGRLVAIVEGGGGPAAPGRARAAAAFGGFVAESGGPPVEPGTQEVAVAVTVTYGIAP